MGRYRQNTQKSETFPKKANPSHFFYPFLIESHLFWFLLSLDHGHVSIRRKNQSPGYKTFGPGPKYAGVSRISRSRPNLQISMTSVARKSNYGLSAATVCYNSESSLKDQRSLALFVTEL